MVRNAGCWRFVAAALAMSVMFGAGAAAQPLRELPGTYQPLIPPPPPFLPPLFLPPPLPPQVYADPPPPAAVTMEPQYTPPVRGERPARVVPRSEPLFVDRPPPPVYAPPPLHAGPPLLIPPFFFPLQRVPSDEYVPVAPPPGRADLDEPNFNPNAPRYGAPPPGVAAPPPGVAEEPRVATPANLRRQIVPYPGKEAPGTIVIDTPNTYLYFVLPGGQAVRYGIGVGREGFDWAGVEKITRKQEWPDWHPPAEMIERQPNLPRFMAGGPGNPLGARAMYLGKTLYRIHGTSEPDSIGKRVSSGCIRLLNEDVIDLFERTTVGTTVVVLPASSRGASIRGPSVN